MLAATLVGSSPAVSQSPVFFRQMWKTRWNLAAFLIELKFKIKLGDYSCLEILLSIILFWGIIDLLRIDGQIILKFYLQVVLMFSRTQYTTFIYLQK